MVTGIIALRKLNSKVVRIPLAQIGDTFFGKGSGKTVQPVIDPVLMDITGKADGATTSLEVQYGDHEFIFVTSWRAVGITKCKLS